MAKSGWITPQEALRRAIKCLDSGKVCDAEVWMEVAKKVIWNGIDTAPIIKELEQELATEPDPIRCWDCRLAKREAIKELGAL